MQVVVVPPDGNAVVVDELALLLIHLVGEILIPAAPVGGGVEQGLMHHNQVGPQLDSPADDVYRGHQCGDNAGALRLRVAGFPLVAALIARSVGVVGQNFFDDFSVFHDFLLKISWAIIAATGPSCSFFYATTPGPGWQSKMCGTFEKKYFWIDF